ncbi:MAG: outer membrane protein assembly factor BamA [Kiritimatiellae bacterium]|nr:outer membrane protein assembly factor BamA [Kiritimatiellia bacterium]MDW8457631.1 outer membrane protein assembly factor BamA [Verrucomicrobiota bacterium]
MKRWGTALWALWVGCAIAGAPAFGAEIREIRIERRGGGPVDEAVVRSFISVKVGDELTRAALARDVRALQQSGRFAYVAADVEDAPGGVAVIYQVRSKPRIRLIRIEGADEIGNAKVRELLALGPGDLVDDAVLALRAKAVQEHYQKKLFPDASLSWTIREDEIAGTADVIVQVKEGPRARIRRIRFGDLPDPGRAERAARAIFPWFFDRPPVTGHDLRRPMKQRQSNIFSWLTGAGTYKPDELDADLETVRRELRDRGFLDAKVGDPVLERVGEKKIDILIPVETGPRYRFGEIRVVGPKKFPIEDVRRTVTNRPNDVATQTALNRAHQAVRDFYGSRGYIRSEIQSSVSPRQEEPVVDVEIAVREEGEPVRVRDVVIRGNTRTKDKVIRREVTVLPGDVYNDVRVRNTELRLRNLGYFDLVAAEPVDTPTTNLVDLAINVEERRTGQFLIGAGFSSVDDLIGFAELSQGNFDLFNWPPVGGGQKLRLRGTAGTKRNDLELTFTEPWLFDRRLALTVNLYRRNRSYLSRVYEQRETGGEVGIGVPLDAFTRFNLSYGLENIKIHNVDADASEFFQSQAGDYLKSSLNASVVRDSRDSAFIPTRGTRSSLGGMYAGGPLGGDVDVYNVEAQVSTFVPLWYDHVFNLRLWTSVVEPHGDAEDVPVFERLYLGGARTLRAFKFRRVGPKDENRDPIGGQTAWFGAAEYTIPVYEKLRFALFYDIGYVYREPYEWDFSTYNSDWGVGLRIDFPAFPLRFDYAWPIETDPDDRRRSGRFQFMIGYSL